MPQVLGGPLLFFGLDYVPDLQDKLFDFAISKIADEGTFGTRRFPDVRAFFRMDRVDDPLAESSFWSAGPFHLRRYLFPRRQPFLKTADILYLLNAIIHLRPL